MSDGKYIYDGWNVIAEYNLSGSTLTRQKVHYWGPDISGSLQGAGGVGGLVAPKLEVGTTGTFYTGYDPNGNVTEMFNSSGANVAHYEYDAFGKTVNSAGTLATTFKMRFSTKFWDDESSLYYYGYRYYDPNHGRWLNRDPIGEKGGLNLYTFVKNNGVTNLDLNGLIDWEGVWDALGEIVEGIGEQGHPGMHSPLPPREPTEVGEANRQFHDAIRDWVSGVGGGISYGPDDPWTKQLALKPVYDRMRNELKKRAHQACKDETTDQFLQTPLRWDDSADSYPAHTPFLDGLNYILGTKLKSVGSTDGAISITSISCCPAEFCFQINVSTDLRLASATRIRKTNGSIIPDMPVGLGFPFQNLHLSWTWSECHRFSF